jgi:uncharacterized hydrophobic protein (TIGR00271 family)
LRHQVQDDGALTRGYMLMCGLAAGIAALGLLQSSTAVVIGAMLVSPLMSPIAALGFGFASIDGQRIRDAARVVLVGAAIGIAAGMLITWISPIRNATPELLARTQPTLLDLAVALLSGIAGGYATVMGKGGTAIGVAIATALMPPLTTVGYGIAAATHLRAGRAAAVPDQPFGHRLCLRAGRPAVRRGAAIAERAVDHRAYCRRDCRVPRAGHPAGHDAGAGEARGRCVRRRGMRSSRFQASGHQHRANGRALAPVRRSLDKCGRHRPAICGERRTARPRSPCRQSRACGLGQFQQVLAADLPSQPAP